MIKESVLGNDPFARGAAVREAPAAASALPISTKPRPRADDRRPTADGAETASLTEDRSADAAPKVSSPKTPRKRATARKKPLLRVVEGKREPLVEPHSPEGFASRAFAVASRIMASPGVQKVVATLGSSSAVGRAFWLAVRAAGFVARSRVGEKARALLPAAHDAAGTAVASKAASGVVATAVSAVETALRIATARSVPSKVDDFGEDPSLVERVAPVFDFLYERYWRLDVAGASNVPQGPCIVVCNHSGALPFDGPMMRTVLRREARRPDARWLVEDAIAHAPFVGAYLNRLGAVRACPENAERLLDMKAAVVVFPEGVQGMGKITVGWVGGSRYRVCRFGRGGFVKLALRARVPIVPAAIVGAEEALPLLARLPARSLGFPFVPITPTFPLLGPFGLVPLPTKWVVRFLPAIDVTKHPPHSEDDAGLVASLTEDVRSRVQAALDEMVASRKSAFLG